MANYKEASIKLSINEGAYQKHPNDRGNYNSNGDLVGTKFGISGPVLEEWRNMEVISELDMFNLPKNEAEEIYRRNYWPPIMGDQIENQKNAEFIYDHAVNTGIGRTRKLVQQVLISLGEKIELDGIFGNLTIQSLNKVDSNIFFEEFKNERIKYYKSISNGRNRVFLDGWINRVLRF